MFKKKKFSFTDEIQLLKKFSSIKINSVFWKFQNVMNISSFLKTEYYRVGVFIDSRCHNSENINLVMIEVSFSIKCSFYNKILNQKRISAELQV